MQESQCFVFEPFRLDGPDERLWRGHTVVPLPPKPFAILCCLVAQAGRLVTKRGTAAGGLGPRPSCMRK